MYDTGGGSGEGSGSNNHFVSVSYNLYVNGYGSRRYYNYEAGGTQTKSSYICGKEKASSNGTEWIGKWSEKYYVTGIYSVIGDRINTNTYGQNRIRWVKRQDGTYGTPVNLSTLNSFPYWVDNVTCFNTETGNTYTNFSNITGDNTVSSIPMPSTGTGVSTKTDTVTISYKTKVLNKFNATFTDGTKNITLNINYKERPCYHMYDGTSQTDTQVDSQTTWTGLHRKGATENPVNHTYTGGDKNIYVKD